MERTSCQVLMIRVTMYGTVAKTTKRKAGRTTVYKFINQCCSLEHAVVIYREPVELL